MLLLLVLLQSNNNFKKIAYHDFLKLYLVKKKKDFPLHYETVIKQITFHSSTL